MSSAMVSFIDSSMSVKQKCFDKAFASYNTNSNAIKK